jgi:hypothetical protein
MLGFDEAHDGVSVESRASIEDENSDAMTESNFATSSVRAAVNIVLTVSRICVCSAVRRFCWALIVEMLAENISAKAMVAGTTLSSDEMEVPPNCLFPNRHARYLFPRVSSRI